MPRRSTTYLLHEPAENRYVHATISITGPGAHTTLEAMLNVLAGASRKTGAPDLRTTDEAAGVRDDTHLTRPGSRSAGPSDPAYEQPKTTVPEPDAPEHRETLDTLTNRIVEAFGFDAKSTRAYLEHGPNGALKPLQQRAIDNYLSEHANRSSAPSDSETAVGAHDPKPNGSRTTATRSATTGRTERTSAHERTEMDTKTDGVYGLLEENGRRILYGPEAWLRKQDAQIVTSAEKMRELYREGKLWRYRPPSGHIDRIADHEYGLKLSHSGQVLDPRSDTLRS